MSREIEDQVDARRAEEKEKLQGDVVEEVARPQDDPDFILRCLEHNERGDGILFATIHRGRFVYVKSRDEKAKAWFEFNGNHWQIDKADNHHAAVEDVALLYQRESERLDPIIYQARGELRDANDAIEHQKSIKKQLGKDATDEELAEIDRVSKEASRDAALAKANLNYNLSLKKDLDARVDRLRTLRGAKNCLEYAHKIGVDGLYIYGDEVDQKPMLLPCANGVIDLETGKLLEGNPDDYLVRAIPVEFKGIDEPCPDWELFIDQIHREQEDLINFIGRFMGYSITGKDSEQVYACFIGEGANGKGTMFEILREILGELSWSINPEMLLDSKAPKNSDGPSPGIMSLQGRRLVVASETDEGRKLSGAQIKRFTGGDTLTGRNLFDKYDTNFTPTHTLALLSNHTPRGLASDFALLRRLLYIEYPLRFVDNVEYWRELEPQHAELFMKKDEGLKKRLQDQKSGILAWLVRNCLKWQAGGLMVPESIRAAVEEVRKKEDFVEQFLEACCKSTADNEIPATLPATQCVYFSSLYDRFVKWYSQEHGDGSKGGDRYMIKKRKFGEQLRKKGYLIPEASKTSGKTVVHGLTFDTAGHDDHFSWREAPEGGGGADQL